MNSNILKILVFLCFFFKNGIAGLGAEVVKSPETQNTLIELYTSQGCSSCPSAEAWLSQLEKNPKLFRIYFPVAFHVDYWDYLGWKDPFSSPLYAKRQKHIARERKKSSLFTPQILFNGEERFWWRLRALPKKSKKKVGVLKLITYKNFSFETLFKPSLNIKTQQFILYSAYVGFGLKNTPLKGENKGVKLKNDFVVLSFEKKTLQKTAPRTYFLKKTHRKRLKKIKKMALIVWVSPKGSQKPLQVIGTYLP